MYYQQPSTLCFEYGSLDCPSINLFPGIISPFARRFPAAEWKEEALPLCAIQIIYHFAAAANKLCSTPTINLRVSKSVLSSTDGVGK